MVDIPRQDTENVTCSAIAAHYTYTSPRVMSTLRHHQLFMLASFKYAVCGRRKKRICVTIACCNP